MTREDFIKRAVPKIKDDYGEVKNTTEERIIFPNGRIAYIVNNLSNPEKNAKKTVAVCDYNGFFDWEILNKYGADGGCFYCNTEDEICHALSIIESISK